MITDNAEIKIARFNEIGLHYNLVADSIYKKRYSDGIDIFSEEYLRYVIAGLISFEMERMMGSGSKYDFNNGFALRLFSKLQQIRPVLTPLINLSLAEININQESQESHNIMEIYNTLSTSGIGALHENPEKYFHVGATKVLHFLNPRLFIIIDSNAARAFRLIHNVPFRNTTQPGYSADLYLQCMKCAREEIKSYGVERLQALEPDTPITRIFDKLTFVTGAGL
jgi:hypothetical protein